MLERILVQFTKEEEVQHLCEYLKLLKEKYADIEITGIYVKDLEKFPTSALYGIEDKWNELEDKHAETIKAKFLEYLPHGDFVVKPGHISNIILKELRLYDILVLDKPKKVTHPIRELLRVHHKPVLMIPKLESYSLENILIADDQKFEVNKAFFDFVRIFSSIDKFKAITVNSDEEEAVDLNVYLKKLNKSIEYISKSGSDAIQIIETAEEFDLLVMGNLKYSFIFEKMADKTGVKLIQKLEKPIFIG